MHILFTCFTKELCVLRGAKGHHSIAACRGHGQWETHHFIDSSVFQVLISQPRESGSLSLLRLICHINLYHRRSWLAYTFRSRLTVFSEHGALGPAALSALFRGKIWQNAGSIGSPIILSQDHQITYLTWRNQVKLLCSHRTLIWQFLTIIQILRSTSPRPRWDVIIEELPIISSSYTLKLA